MDVIEGTGHRAGTRLVFRRAGDCRCAGALAGRGKLACDPALVVGAVVSIKVRRFALCA